MYDLKSYDFNLPRELIAQVPAESRDHSRLLVVDRLRPEFREMNFFDLPDLLESGDLLVVNNTSVVPARIEGRKETGGRVELLVLEHPESLEDGDGSRICLLKSSKGAKTGSVLHFADGLTGQVKDVLGDGKVRIEFSGKTDIDSLLDKSGVMPLPPYIKRDGVYLRKLDRERYQTVFSSKRGAVAAPTAGLHFTRELSERLGKKGVDIAQLTLHVGYGTFSPVRTEDIRGHRLDEEFYRIEADAAEAINRTKKNGGRVIAVGTTVVRTLETAGISGGLVRQGEGMTGLLVTPGYSFKVVDALITNFHLPKSSLLFLVSALAGTKRIREAYRFAIENRYRFYSYGDAMLIA